MKKTAYSVGPKFFGTTPKKSWFDEGDRCSPGPGTHTPNLNATNPTWTTPKDSQRDSFLQKHRRQYPSPNRYKVVSPDKTHVSSPAYSMPLFKPKENSNKIDQGSSVDYRPRYNFPKQKHPNYSFGYQFSRDYTTGVPPPNVYNPTSVGKKHFNKTQKSFSVGQRPMPFGQEATYPFVGKYNVSSDMAGSKYSIGKTTRPNYKVGAGADQIYNISSNIQKSGQGKTMGLLLEVPRNKDQEDFPSPDHYNPTLPKSERNIINYRSKRQEIKNQAVEKNPSPNKYCPQLNKKQQTVSFPKQIRQSPEPDPYPGVGTYQIEAQLGSSLGQMGHKLKKNTDAQGPSPSSYEPKDTLIKPQNQRPINFESDRVDFSRSITGAKVGPGLYAIQKQSPIELGKIGKSQKFEPNRNKNPGPGSYNIPNGIGKLPAYCIGPKKLNDNGFSCLQLEKQERMRKERVRVEARVKAAEQQEQRVLLEQQKSAEVK